MSNLIEHAKKELSLIGGENDPMQDQMNSHILKMVEEFSKEGHSGFSASYAVSALQKLLRFQPLTPLTGDDSEWMEVGENMFQNVRCGTVFKNGKNGQAYNIDGNVFRDQNGCSYTNGKSRTKVDFPWMPNTPNIVDYYDEDSEAPSQ